MKRLVCVVAMASLAVTGMAQEKEEGGNPVDRIGKMNLEINVLKKEQELKAQRRLAGNDRDLPKIISILKQSDKSVAKLRMASGIEKTVKVGDTLNGSTKVESISANTVTVRAGKSSVDLDFVGANDGVAVAGASPLPPLPMPPGM